ncbi:MAG TPA: pre-toxin TG domain-containing protein [Vicinamibacteria bacterium]|jgi:hypothetical protein|nr:pre-toxin TG domain-containing protein [Vicinamibacteria bacterium]
MSAPDFELHPIEAPFEVPHLDPTTPPGDPVAQDGGVLVPPAAGADASPTYISQAVLEADTKLASSLLNLVPVVGEVKGVIEAFTGKDLITGEHKVWWERGLNIAALAEAEEGPAIVVKVVETIHVVHELVHVAHVGIDIYELNEAAERSGEGKDGGVGEGTGQGDLGGLNPPPSLPH